MNWSEYTGTRDDKPPLESSSCLVYRRTDRTKLDNDQQGGACAATGGRGSEKGVWLKQHRGEFGGFVTAAALLIQEAEDHG